LKEEIKFPGGKDFLEQSWKKIGFKFKNCKNMRSFLIEKMIPWCGSYIFQRIKITDELGSNNKLVVYLDETWIHPTYTVSKHQQNSMTGHVT
jgi:hypothetical protein